MLLVPFLSVQIYFIHAMTIRYGFIDHGRMVAPLTDSQYENLKRWLAMLAASYIAIWALLSLIHFRIRRGNHRFSAVIGLCLLAAILSAVLDFSKATSVRDPASAFPILGFFSLALIAVFSLSRKRRAPDIFDFKRKP